MSLKFYASLGMLAILVGGSAAYAAIATGVTSAIIQESAGILVTKDLTFQAQIPSGAIAGAAAAVATVGSTATTNAVGGATLAPQGGTPANLTVTGAAGDTVSVSVPQTFSVTSTGGAGVLTINTIGGTTNSVLGGGLRGNGALSVDVGGRIALAGQVVTPGDYSGVLLVIGQYN